MIKHNFLEPIPFPPPQKKGVLEGESPPVAKRLFNYSHNSPQSSSKPPGQQIDICLMLMNTTTYTTNKEAAQKAMGEDILLQEKEEKDKASRIQTLRKIYEKKSSLNALTNRLKGIMWSDNDPATMPATFTHLQGPPSTN
jgi:hypothetical protein